MTLLESARQAIELRAAQLRQRDRLLWISCGALCAVGVAALARLQPEIAMAAGISGLALGVRAWRQAQRQLPLTPEAVASTLDATTPALQASAALLLRPQAELSMLQRLQAARIASDATNAATTITLPRARQRMPRLLAAAGALLLLIGIAWPAAGSLAPRSPLDVPLRDDEDPKAPPRITQLDVTVRPPAYTGKPTRTTSELDLEVEYGATVTWTLRASDTLPVIRLATSDRDTVPVTRGADGRYTVRLLTDHPLLYEFVGPRIDGLPTGVRRLAVLPDRAPVLTVVTPEERTVIESGEPLTVPVEVLGKDDYGIASAQIVATVTTGSGENVKFREQRLPFAQTQSRGDGGMLWRTTLDLEALGVQAGDELYFHVIATDRRTPRPNEGRSETVFIRRADTTRAMLAEFSGLALKVVPDYFRSQRQIIIDTEKLLADQKSISLEQFRERANNIGIDQNLLRVRYGELVGDENESGLGSSMAEQLEEAGIETGEDHAHEELPQAEQLGPKMPELPEDAVHRHDDSENATRLATSVKATLQSALSEMWSAERHLRTYDPRKALPYEYRALEFLKQVQQAARVYVKRVGFEPPPIDEQKKRLSGKLDAIRDVNRQRDTSSRDRYPAVRALLADWPGTAAPSDPDRRRIQAAGEELAREALERPGTHVNALRDLRRWLDQGASCAECASLARAQLYAAVPAPDATAPARAPVSAARKAFLDRLRTLE